MSPNLQTQSIKWLPVMMGMVMLLSSSLKVVDAAVPPTIAKPGCLDRCGNVTIPFPFGIGEKCFLDSWYEITCNTSAGSTIAFLSKFNIEVMQITLPKNYSDRLQSVIVVIPSLNMCKAHTQGFMPGINLTGSPYNFSTDHNVFITEGCPGSAALIDESNTTVAGCGTVCNNNNNSSAVLTNKCNGIECCQVQLPSERSNGNASPLQFYQIRFYGESSGLHNNCLVASLIKNDSVNHYIGKLSYQSTVPVLLYWSWLSSQWPNSNPGAICSPDEEAHTIDCYCEGNFVGNPYLLNGCQECKNCGRTCTWNRGNSSYDCVAGNASDVTMNTVALAFAALSVVIGTLLVAFVCRGLYRFTKRRRKTYRRVVFLKLKLQQHQSSNEGVVERTKLFTHKHLSKATDHFNENRILGKGGQGTVYKGMLIDGTIVAVKTSKLLDESHMKQFINEVVVLSQINHINVVKLLACCFEKEVPLLVYEFISNGTLSKHIHDPDEDFVLSWPMRLKIAADSAGAIAYLHSSSSTPIYHRDIKPSNILLDDKYKAKVSDFGSSKTFVVDQTDLPTRVQGTIGYLDPEYFESNVFTEKSDVYSFGVVLLELLTSKKPIYRTETMEQKTLVVEFFLVQENSSLFNILDPKVVKEAKEEELMATIDLAKHCLNGSGRLRPTMKEVAMRLEMIIKSPAEMSTQDQQTLWNEMFGEMVIPETTNLHEFMTTPICTAVSSPLYIDVHPLLHDTI